IDADGIADAQDLGLTDPFVADNPAPNVALALTVSGSGSVRVWPTFAGCYQADSTCAISVRQGMPITLTPWALPGWVFAGWLGGASCPGLGTCTYTATGPAAITALFVRDPGGALSSSVLATPTSVDFGLNTMHIVSAARTILVDNFTAAAVTVSSIGIDNAVFAQTSTCTVIAAGSNCRIDVTFTPTAAGATSATLAIATSAGNINIPLAGTGSASLAVHYYRSILGREPDAVGLAFWDSEAARLAALGADPREVYYVMANFFFNSPEYLAANKTDEQFVTDLYETFFNRAPDAGGLAFWTGQITAGTPRYVVLLFFMFSPEFQSFSTGIFGNAQARPEVNMVMDFFRGFLNRLPDTAAFNFWVGQLRTAQCQGANSVYNAVNVVSLLFLSSAEYTARARDNTQFVTDLYNAILRRGGEAPGVQFWVDQLNTAAQDRNSVRLQFILGPEFAARVNAVVTAGCMP
ncbi:MAG TPA: DUF4214 domain-containing protein, partial [Usitatibacter sp.]|nr:DUF4214 domain-containing protein [Usitatibacter sp.]